MMVRSSGSLPVVLPLLSSGCGTIANITAPTTPSSGYRAFGPTSCEPFGGVQRSVLAGSAPLMAGPIGIIPAVVAVGVDTPLSFVGDVVTLPVVYHRLRSTPQGEQTGPAGVIEPSRQGPPTPEPPQQ
jgi:uncharacterized protein YceK